MEKGRFIARKKLSILLPKPQPGFPQQEVSYIKALGMTTGNLWTQPGGKG